MEFGAARLEPRLTELQKYLDGKEIPRLRPEILYLSNFGWYFFDEEGRKSGRIAFPAFHLWRARSRDPLNKVTLEYIEIVLSLGMDKYLARRSRLKPFLGGGFGLYGSSLQLNGRDLATFSIYGAAHGGLEFDIIKRRLYLRLEGGYRQNLPMKFTKDVLIDVERSGGPGSTYVYQETDRLNVKEQISGPLYGVSVGVIF